MSKKVLIVDDEEGFCKTVKDYLQESGKFEVEILTDSRTAVNTAKAFMPDIILLDLRMPHVGGFEVCELLSNDKETEHIPIIVTTALSDDGDIKKAYHMGASGYLVKPVEFHELLEEIDKLLSD